jgi:hypothetical protein
MADTYSIVSGFEVIALFGNNVQMICDHQAEATSALRTLVKDP